jgi:hypothetical protein
MPGNNLKQIQDFDLRSTVIDSDQFVLQTAGGTTLKTTKSALLNDTNAVIIGIQTQLDSLSGAGDNEIRGQEECIVGQQIYTIDIGTTVSDPAPIISLTVPNSLSTIFVQGIFAVTTTNFKVMLSDAPSEAGYIINWSVKAPTDISDFDTLSFTELDDTPTTYVGSDNFLVSVSGSSLQFTDPDVITSSIRSQVITISGDLTNLQNQFNNLDVTYATDASLASISGNLQEQITNNDLDISILSNNVTTISGDLSITIGEVTTLETNTTGITGGITQINEVVQKTWVSLVNSWTTTPTLNINISGSGDVYDYVYGGTTYYRLVPDPYDSTLDSFYENFDGSNLTGLIATRGQTI